MDKRLASMIAGILGIIGVVLIVLLIQAGIITGIWAALSFLVMLIVMAIKGALPHVMMTAYGMPEAKAYGIIETQPISKLRALVEASGYAYTHTMRRWVRCAS